jgi:RNA polymerase sigma-70 factor (ECF subfamily)
MVTAENDSPTQPGDLDLMRRLQDGDPEAFETLYERYQAPIARHLANIVHDEAAAQDLLQEVFLRVWTRAGQFAGRGSFKTWLYRIATNLAFNHLRHRRRRRELPLEIPSATTEADESESVPAWLVDASALGPDRLMEIAEQQVLFQRLVAGLSAEKQAVFRLVHTYEMTAADAAEELGLPEGTVKSRLHYAKKQIAAEWQAFQEGLE